MLKIPSSDLMSFRFDLSEYSPWVEEPEGDNIRYMIRLSDHKKRSFRPNVDFVYPDSGYVYCKTGYGIHGFIDGLKGIKLDILYFASEALSEFDLNCVWQVLAFDYRECVRDHECPINSEAVRVPRAWVIYTGDCETAYVLIGMKNGRIKSRLINDIVYNSKYKLSPYEKEQIRSELIKEIISRVFWK